MEQHQINQSKDNFDRIANNVEEWRRSAESLATAAKVLRDNRPKILPPNIKMSEAYRYHQVLWSELMLWGMSLEDFLKSLILKNGGTLSKAGKFQGHSKHDLSAMATQAQFDPTPDQKPILDSLSDIVTWSGRYPIPKDFSKVLGPRQWTVPSDDNMVDSLVSSLRDSLKEK